MVKGGLLVIDGSLLKGMQQAIHSLAVLVIDELDCLDSLGRDSPVNRFAHSSVTSVAGAQQRIIMLAQRYFCPVILVKMDHRVPEGSYFYNQRDDSSPNVSGTKKSLRNLLPMTTRVINKHYRNAFINTNLARLLAEQYQCGGVKDLVVIGFNSNVCIPATIGSATNKYGFGNKNGPGATDYNLIVHTCQQVLNGDPVTWPTDSPLIRFYSHL